MKDADKTIADYYKQLEKDDQELYAACADLNNPPTWGEFIDLVLTYGVIGYAAYYLWTAIFD